MAIGAEDMLCKALDLEQKALDFYAEAQERCPSQLGRKVFGVLAEDKMRLTTRLAEIHAAINQGMSLDGACVLAEDDEIRPQPFALLSAGENEVPKSCAEELNVLMLALEVEQTCLRFFEDQLREAKERDIRFFLERAMEEERGHFVLLSDMRYYFEKDAQPAT